MPRGASPKREREYEKLEKEFKQEGRYKGREEEVASRIVNKQRKNSGETKAAKRKDRQGESPDRNLPVKGYDQLTVDEVAGKLDDLSTKEVKEIRTYEKKHRSRKTLLEQIDRRLK
jgi:hypothetical protein